MASVETVLSEVIPQQIIPGSIATVQKKDPFLAQVQRSAKGVSKLGMGTSGWKFERVVSLGLGGTVRHVTTLGHAISTAASPLQVYTADTDQLYPTPYESTSPGYDRMTGALSQLRGNITLDEAFLRENMATGIVVDAYKDLMAGVSLRVALAKLACFYTPSSSFRHICTISSWVDSSAGAANFVPAEGNEVLFAEGHIVKIFGTSTIYGSCRHAVDGVSDTGTDLTTKIMVIAVDPITRRVYLQNIGTSTHNEAYNATNNSVADGDIVTHAGHMKGGAHTTGTINGAVTVYGAYGLVDWLVNSGSILGVDTTYFQRLKSLITSNLAGPWTEEEADKHLMWYNRWHQNPIDTLFMTPGALLACKKAALGMFTADRTGKPVKIVGGHTGISHVHDGREITYLQTPYMRSGYLVGVHLAGNFEELHPPRDPSSGGSGGMGSEVEFKVGDGYKSIFRIVSYTDGNAGAVVATTLREAPFCMWYNYWPMKHLPGLMVGGVSESNWA